MANTLILTDQQNKLAENSYHLYRIIHHFDQLNVDEIDEITGVSGEERIKAIAGITEKLNMIAEKWQELE